MKTILLDMGHCLKGGDTGASGCGYREEVLTREIGYKVKSMLESNGFTVHVVSCDSSSSLSESLAYRVNKANELGGDLYVSIHLNAFNGQAYGTEVYTYGGKNLPEAERILSNICALGFYRRGIKDGSRLYVIRNTNMTGLLVECCFIDNQSDMSKFNSDDIAKAIAEGILGKSVGDVTVENKPSQSDTSSNEDYSCKGKYGVVTGNDVRLRDGTSTSSNILGHANKGDKFEIGYKLGDWYSIYWGEHGAFISASYLSISSSNVSKPIQSQPSLSGSYEQHGNATILVDKLMIRTSPSVSASSVGSYSKGETIYNYDRVYNADGYRWIRYVGGSGNYRYVAVRRLSDNKKYANCY